MSELGARLVRARESRGLTLEDAERDTRISRRYLQALEAEQFDAIPAPVYARGFLRSYSQYLGLEPQQMLQLFPRDDDPAYPAQQVPQRPSPQNPMSAVGPARPTWKRPQTKQEQATPRTRPVGRQQRAATGESIPAPLPTEPYEPTIGIDIGVPVPARRIKADPAAQARTLTIAVVALVAVVVVVGLALLISRLGGSDGAAPGTALGGSSAASATKVTKIGTLSPGGASATTVTGSSGVPTNLGTVPKVVDLTLDTARAALEEHRYKVRVLESTTCTSPKGKVCDQAPPAGSQLDENGTVNITVSKGP